MPEPDDQPVALQFYADAGPLLIELGRAMSVALDQGHAAVLAVSRSTRKLLEDQLEKRGIGVDTVRNRGQYVVLDGDETLSRITVNGQPDSRLFDDVVGATAEQLTKAYPGVWMYGELAALLWQRGNEPGALQLDRLWASLAETHPVVLSVAFPVAALSLPMVIEAIAAQIRTLAQGSSIALAVHRGPKQR